MWSHLLIVGGLGDRAIQTRFDRLRLLGNAGTSPNDGLDKAETRHDYTEKASTRNEALGLSTRSKCHRKQKGRAAQLQLGRPTRKYYGSYRFHYFNNKSRQSGNRILYLRI